MKRSPLAALTAFLAALFLLGTAGPALAHDALKSSDPAKGATVESIGKVRLEFTSGVRVPFVVVRGPDGSAYQSGDPEGDGRVVTQKLKGTLPDGKYTIAYRVVSSDGHPIEGEIPFTVKGAPSPSPAATESSTTATDSSTTATESSTTASTAAAQAPATEAPSSPAEASSSQVSAPTEQAAASTSFPVWLLIAVGALVGIGIGFLFSARKGSRTGSGTGSGTSSRTDKKRP
jgi:methionine-rich copper-binding protein CopC